MGKAIGRFLGIDFGLARIGLALSDPGKIIASPFKTLPSQKTTLATVDSILAAVSGESVERIIVGMPLRLNGKNSMMTDEVEHFIKCLKEKAPCPVVTIDERLTTLQAERALMEAEMSRKKRTKVVDTVAAALLLQNYLDMLCIQKERETLDNTSR